MNEETKKLSFKDQLFFIGIDTHKNNWKVTIRSSGLVLKTFSMNPSPKDLFTYMSKNYPDGTFYSVYEAGYSGFWIHRELLNLGIRNIIVNAADVPGTHKEKDRKDDCIDSNKLSRELSNGSLKGIFVPNEYQESIRVLSRTLNQYTRRSTQIKCRIKALLNYLGVNLQIDVLQSWSAAHLNVLSKLQFNQSHNAIVLKLNLDELEHVRKQRLKILNEMRNIARDNQVLKHLRTIPGIGLITSFTLYAELISMDRFKAIDQLASFVGLVPSTSSSDQKTVTRGISQRHSRYLRYVLIESAWVAVKKDPVFTSCYNNLCQRMSKQKAIVRMAKKLLNRIRYVWSHNQVYMVNVIGPDQLSVCQDCNSTEAVA